MSQLIINGGKKLKGIWRPSGNKNEALPLIAASLLFRQGLFLKNVPDLEDVRVMMDIAKALGVKIINKKEGLQFVPSEIITHEIPANLSSKVRGSLLFIAPLLASGYTNIPAIGGDRIGARTIETHLEVFKSFGSKISGSKIILNKKEFFRKRPIYMWLSEPSVTATENAMILAAARPGKTIIKNCACEPHIVGLGSALIKAGAKIKGLGVNILEINGVAKFRKVSHVVGEDFMEAGSALVLSAVCGGRIKVKIADEGMYNLIFDAFKKFGKKVVKVGGYFSVVDGPEPNNGISILSDNPWPSFPSDLMSVMIVLATQCRGQFLFHEKMFESRLYFVDQLKALGAKLVVCDPHRVLVVGPSRLRGANLLSPDIRAGMALLIATLVSRGQSVINNSQQLDRGYENIVSKLKAIGADVERKI
jgi:UDP-N-acetylglucosamine 1-carboxyvinyltransferase